MKLARVFKSHQEQSEKLRVQAEQYYKSGLETLLGLERGEEVRKPALRLWRSKVEQPTEEEVGMILTVARQYLADRKITKVQEEDNISKQLNMRFPVICCAQASNNIQYGPSICSEAPHETNGLLQGPQMQSASSCQISSSPLTP